MFRMVKYAKADQVWNVSVVLYGNQEACSLQTRVFVEKGRENRHPDSGTIPSMSTQWHSYPIRQLKSVQLRLRMCSWLQIFATDRW